MKPPAFLTLASTLLVSACASTPPQEKADVQAPEASASTSTVHTYRCESGETIAAAYPSTDSARVEYKDRRYDMQIAVSGSGARYAGDDLKGSGPCRQAPIAPVEKSWQHRARSLHHTG